jgi:hypothetical protein
MSGIQYCDGLRQVCPNPSQCGIDCHFQTANLVDVTHEADGLTVTEWSPLRDIQKELPVVMFPPEDWIDKYRFWVACVLTSVAIGLGWGLGRLLKLF